MLNNDYLFTHRGWFAFCPVFIADLYSEEPVLLARWRVLHPVFSLAVAVQQASNIVLSAIVADYEPVFMVSITGRIEKPVPEARLPWW